MALIKCVDCGKEISDKATVCINCGCPVEYSINNISSSQHKIKLKNMNPNEMDPLEAQNENSTLTSESSFSMNDKVNFLKKYKKYVCVGVVAIIFIIVITVILNSDNSFLNRIHDSEEDSSGNYSEDSSGNYSEDSSENTDYSDTTEIPKIAYISDRSVDYDDANKRQRVFFGLKDDNKNYISATSGTATIKIVNTGEEVVYSKDIEFSSSDFSVWTSNFWDSSRLLACVYINASDITKGSSDKGTLSITVVADDVSFAVETLNIYDLPTKEITIKLPSLPKSFSDHSYDGSLEATTRIDSITYTSNVYDFDDVTVTFSFKTTMTYNSSPGESKYSHIGYKLKNSSGVIVDSGSIYISQSDEGDVSLTDMIIHDLNMKNTYTLELLDYSN